MKVILIGGVGGSGTRAVTKLFSEMGLFIGSNLNNSLDNMDWPGDRIKFQDSECDPVEKREYFKQRFAHFFADMVEQARAKNPHADCIVVKNPGVFIYLPYIVELDFEFYSIHLIRHGLDMAFSSNKNQLRNWGKHFGVEWHKQNEEALQLKYWINANDYAINTGKTLLGDRFKLMQYENLLHNTKDFICELQSFTHLLDKTSDCIGNFIEIPDSFERYKNYDISLFDKKDIERLEDFGYRVV